MNIYLCIFYVHNRGKDLVRLPITRFATHFLTLQSLLFQAQNLKKMFNNDEWNGSQWAHKHDGKDTKKKGF
jgi:hypothetical protein